MYQPCVRACTPPDVSHQDKTVGEGSRTLGRAAPHCVAWRRRARERASECGGVRCAVCCVVRASMDHDGDASAKGRLTADVITNAPRAYDPAGEYALDLRARRIGEIENLSASRDQYDAIDLSANEIVKVENIPPLKRLRTLYLSNNKIARVNGKELATSCPFLRNVVLTNNKLGNLADVDGLGECPRLTMLSLVGNPVTMKENYRLYVIYKCKALKTLDFQRVKASEREAAAKTFGADDGAAARAKTFTPGEALPEAKEDVEKEEQVPSGPTPEQLLALKVAIANAETLEEVARLEQALASGVVPKDLAI